MNSKEKDLYSKNPGHFTLHYIYREYNFKLNKLEHTKPEKPVVDIRKIHNSQNILGLILALFVSFALSARKTALILRWVFQIQISYQTVINYANAASYYCHEFNLKHKGEPYENITADETYVKVNAKTNYIWFYLCAKNRAIMSYHHSDNRGVIPAISSMSEAFKTLPDDKKAVLYTDGNPSYIAAVQYINSSKKKNHIEHHKVIGLQNLDSESEQYRSFKQLIERLNRTYKGHIRRSNGFKSSNGAIALTTLFVTYYNFLRPHSALKHKVPIQLDFLDDLDTIQAKWQKILSMAYG